MERLYDRPFQDFVAHETHPLIPRVREGCSGLADDLTGCLLGVSLPQDDRSRCGHRVFHEKNP